MFLPTGIGTSGVYHIWRCVIMWIKMCSVIHTVLTVRVWLMMNTFEKLGYSSLENIFPIFQMVTARNKYMHSLLEIKGSDTLH
jgi:hypothetical protein